MEIIFALSSMGSLGNGVTFFKVDHEVFLNIQMLQQITMGLTYRRTETPFLQQLDITFYNLHVYNPLQLLTVLPRLQQFI